MLPLGLLRTNPVVSMRLSTKGGDGALLGEPVEPKATPLAAFSKRYRDPVLYVALFYYTTAASHSFTGLHCSEKDYCNPIRWVGCLPGRFFRR